jgi:parallel beta-helix repeat protein
MKRIKDMRIGIFKRVLIISITMLLIFNFHIGMIDTVDAQPLIINMISPLNGTTWVSEAVDLSVSFDNTASETWYSVDGGANITAGYDCNDFQTTLNLEEGDHYVTVYAENDLEELSFTTTYFTVNTSCVSGETFGEWRIHSGDFITCTNTEMIRYGNTIVESSASLTFQNVTFKMISNAEEVYSLYVYGLAIIDDSQITSWTGSAFDMNEDDGRAHIIVQGSEAKMNISNSEVSYLGAGGFPNGGLVYRDVSSSTISNTTIRNNKWGIYSYHSTALTVENSEIYGDDSSDLAIDLSNSYGWNVITNNTVHDCRDGITLGSANEIVRGNTVFDFDRFGIWSGWPGVDDSLIEFNTVYNSVQVANDPRFGIYIYDSNRNTVRYNTAFNNGMGIHLETYSSENTVEGNTVYNNTWYYGINIELFCDNNVVINNIAHDNIYNIASFRSSYNLIANNTIFNAVQTGLYFEGGDNENNIVRNNLFYSNTDRDIYFWYDANGTVVTDNYFLDDKSNTSIGNVLLYVADRDLPIVFEKNNAKKYYISQDSAAIIKDPSPLDDWFVFRNRGDLSARTDVVFSTNRLATFDVSPFTGIDVYPTHSERIFDDSSDRLVDVTLYNAFLIPSSDSVQATVLNFTTSYKKWTISSVNPSVSLDHTIGDFPAYTEILIKKDGVDWNTYVSDSEGYISFNYDEGITTITFEALAGSFVPPENCTILKQGWNLISVPMLQTEQDIICVLDSIDGWYDAIQWYDASDAADNWKHYKVGKPFGNDLSELNETMGFWVHITKPGGIVFIYNGTQPTLSQQIMLYKGWNLVGYPSLTSYNRSEGLNNLAFDSEVDAIWTYNTEIQTWKEMGEGDSFAIGRGYWVHTKDNAVWDVPL